MRNRDQQHRPNRSRSQRIQKCIPVPNSKLRKNPSPYHRPDQPNQNIPNASKPPPPRHLSRQTPRQQPNHQPPDQPSLPLHNHHVLLPSKSKHPKHSNHSHPPAPFCVCRARRPRRAALFSSFFFSANLCALSVSALSLPLSSHFPIPIF